MMTRKSSTQPQLCTVPMSFKRMLRRKEVELKTGLAKTTIYRLMQQGLFPKNYSVGIRAVAWNEQEIDDWLQAQPGKGSEINC